MITELTEIAEADGRQLLENLDQLEVKVSAALWLKDPDTEKWSLVLSMPDAARRGIRWAYQRVQEAIELFGSPQPFDLGRVKVIPFNDPLLKALRVLLGQRPKTGRVRVTASRVNDFYISDVIVYRI